MSRTCTLHSAQLPITITLTADGLVLASGTFAIFDASNNQLESWTMKTGSSGTDTHTRSNDPSKVAGSIMTWDVSVCSMSDQVSSTTVAITVNQDIDCPCNPPASYPLSNLGLCSTGAYSEIQDQLQIAITPPAS